MEWRQSVCFNMEAGSPVDCSFLWICSDTGCASVYGPAARTILSV